MSFSDYVVFFSGSLYSLWPDSRHKGHKVGESWSLPRQPTGM